MIYLLDTFIAFILQHVLAYRRRVIESNLRSALDYQTAREWKADMKAYYMYIAKVFRQIIAGPTSTLLQKRMYLVPHPGLNTWLAEGKSVLITFGHCGNWEWAGSYLGMQYPDQVCALYKKIKSGYVDRLMYNRRLTQVNYLIEIGQIGELLRLMKRKPVLVLMLADQNPGSDQGIIWAPFFGRDTAFVNGPESLALRYQLPVVYMQIQAKANGLYELSCLPVYDGTEKVEPSEITRRFASLLENNIRNNRVEWLWSHRRWKRSRGQGA